MSFFEEDDEKAAVPAGRRRPSARRGRGGDGTSGGSGGGSAGGRPDSNMLTRRLIAFAGAILLVVILAFVVRAVLDSRGDSALEDYNREARSIIRESDEQGDQFFGLLDDNASESAQDLQTAISGHRVTADKQLEQARALDVPGDMASAHDSLLIALEMRRDGLDAVARKIRAAKGDAGDSADSAVRDITGQMGTFLASDVLLQVRTTPLIRAALEEEEVEVGDREVARTSNFLPSKEWLDDETVADKLEQNLTSGPGGKPAPGPHGTGLLSVKAGEGPNAKTLGPASESVPNNIPRDVDALVVEVANQGASDEFDVKVVARLEGDGDPIRLEKTVDTIVAGQTAEVALPLTKRPPPDTPVTISVEIEPVPGEVNEDNNKQRYQARFL